MIEDIIK